MSNLPPSVHENDPQAPWNRVDLENPCPKCEEYEAEKIDSDEEDIEVYDCPQCGEVEVLQETGEVL